MTRRGGQGAIPSAKGVIAACAIVLSACGTPQPRVTDAVRVGATLPLTGADRGTALAMKGGYERAVTEANAAGGVRVGGVTLPVRLDLRDDTADAAALETQVEALIEAGAHLVLATPQDVRAVVEANITERAGVLLIGNPVDHPGLPGKRMEWMVSVDASAADPGARAQSMAAVAIAGVSRAASLEAGAIRTALHARN